MPPVMQVTQSSWPHGHGLYSHRFGSDMWYDYIADKTYLLSDRGPGGGVIAYDTRWHAAQLAVDRTTGAALGCVERGSMGVFPRRFHI
jgi:hypothetical protein